MGDLLAVFRSRTQAVQCRTMLCERGVRAEVVPTPSYLKLGCGFSVKIPAAAAETAKKAIERAAYSAFYGYVRLDGTRHI